MTEKHKLELEMSRLYKRLNAIKYKEAMEYAEGLIAMVGNCYVYCDNSYGGNSKKWDVWKRITGFQRDSEGYVHFIVEEFAVDANGACKFSSEQDYVYHDGREPFDGWQRCDLQDFLDAKDAFWTEVNTSRSLIKDIKKKG